MFIATSTRYNVRHDDAARDEYPQRRDGTAKERADGVTRGDAVRRFVYYSERVGISCEKARRRFMSASARQRASHDA